MSYIVKQIDVEKFRGGENKTLKLHDKANFIIGKNGCGKTTLIKMIKAAIDLDIASFNDFFCEGIEIQYKRISKNPDIPKLPCIQIKLSTNESTGNRKAEVRYKDETNTTYKPIFKGLSEERVLRHSSAFNRNIKNQAARKLKKTAKFHKHLNLSWFSIQRNNTRSIERNPFEEDFDYGRNENPLDDRINDVVRDTSSYLSEMDSDYKTVMSAFEQTYFGLMLKVYDSNTLSRFNLKVDDQKYALSSILTELGMNKKEHEQNINDIYNTLISENKEDDPVKYNIALSSAKKISQLISEWEEAQKKIEEIYKPKEDFINVISELFSPKEVTFSNSNKPIFQLSDRKLRLTALSSGEKQMLIFMHEALNQKNTPSIYIADEPELSLHVDWQESLVGNILNLNPQAQIIFATHSPDIVGKNISKLIDLSK